MSVPQSILLASGNRHKCSEISAVFHEIGITVQGLDTLSPIDEPLEDGHTFLANALIKARYYAAKTGRLVLADDSGLQVDALRGAPGVKSARYSGVNGPRHVVDSANNEKLLQQLHDVPDEKRTARFVCVLVLADGERVWAAARGEVAGLIGYEPRGENGFGYDPLFVLPQRGVTTAQLAPRQKNAISHRGRAVRKMARILQTMRA